MDSINLRYNLNLNQLTYFRLVTVMIRFKTSFRSTISENHIPYLQVCEFLTNFKKGSRAIRKVIELKKNLSLKASHNNTTISFYQLLAMDIETEESLRKLNILWDIKSVPNNIREFFLN